MELRFIIGSRLPAARELADALAFEMRRLGHSASPDADGELNAGAVPVLVEPDLDGGSSLATASDLARGGILISLARPDTPEFGAHLALAHESGGVMSTWRSSVSEFRRHGAHVDHLQVGYSSFWEQVARQQRVLDVLFTGKETPRNAVKLASYAGSPRMTSGAA